MMLERWANIEKSTQFRVPLLNVPGYSLGQSQNSEKQIPDRFECLAAEMGSEKEILFRQDPIATCLFV